MGIIVSPQDWDDWRWSGRARIGGGTAPAFDNFAGTGVYCWQFVNGRELHCSDLQLPHDYAEGTDLQPHIHWMQTTDGVYEGTWTLDVVSWLSAAPDTIMEDKLTLTSGFETLGFANAMHTQNFNDVIPGLGRKISSIIHARLRLTLTSGTRCALGGLDAHYQKDRFGSRTATAK